MADSDSTAAKHAEDVDQKLKKARDILNGMSPRRINPARIKMKETQTGKKGGQGIVVIGTLSPPGASKEGEPEMKVAVKKLEWKRNDAEESTKFFKSFVNELSLMASLSHPNIIVLVGFVEDMQKGDAWMILPWEGNGNVREFLQSGDWDIPERVSLIRDTVNGLEYLHTRQPPVCHGDLKSFNILIDDSYRAVITDFSSARSRWDMITAEETHFCVESPHQAIDDNVTQALNFPRIEFDPSTSELTLTGPCFSLRWTAPEVLNNGVQDLSSDMWNIAWVCWEILTGQIPFENVNRESIIITHLIKGKLPAIREDAQLSHVLQLCGLMSDCWMLDPAKRIDVSTFRRKVRFVPSITPSGYTSGSMKVRSADLLLELGRMYDLQNNTAMAESHYQSALDVANRTKDSKAIANALICLGSIYSIRSKYLHAEKALVEAHEIHSRIGNGLGAGNALIGLGEVYRDRSRYREAEKAFTEAYEIHFRIGIDHGVADALNGLGGVYSDQFRYREAEKAFMEAYEMHCSIGKERGAADALNGLGGVHSDQSRYREAEKAFLEAQEIHSRIGNELGAADALNGLGEVYSNQSRYHEAEKAFLEMHEIHSRVGNDRGAADALAGLGKVYSGQTRHHEAGKAFMEAHEIHSRIGIDHGVARALNGLGGVYSNQSRYCEAEQAFLEAREIHSRVGNDRGAADALAGLGKVYSGQSRDSEAEQAFSEAHEIHSRIGNDLGVGNVLIGLGGIYDTKSRSSEAEKVLIEAHKIHSRIGTCIGTATALIALGDIYDAQSRDSEAEQAYRDAQEILSRIDKEFRATNVPKDPEDTSDAEPWDPEDEEALREASETHPRTLTRTRTGDEQEDEEQPREIPPAGPRNLSEIRTAPADSSFDDGTFALMSQQNPDQSNDPQSGSLLVPSTPVYKATEASSAEASSPPCSPQSSATSHDTPYLLQLPSQQMYQASASSRLTTSVANLVSSDNQQERFLTEQLASIDYVPASATEELVDLLHSLGRAAPQAVRNKHKIYSILRLAHDTCSYVVETGNPPGGQKDVGIKHLLDRMERYGTVLDALEEILLEFAEILPSEITVFGPEMYSSWLQSRSIFARVLDELCHPPFPTTSYKTQDIAEDSFFDDCSWLSRLLYSGIDAEVAVQFPDPPTAHPVLAVTNGFHYLVSQIKYGTQNEQTRELVIEIATLLAQTLAATSPNHDSELRQREPSPPIAASRDCLIQALANSFSILDLDTALEASTTQELASKWTEIKTRLTSPGMSAPEN